MSSPRPPAKHDLSRCAILLLIAALKVYPDLLWVWSFAVFTDVFRFFIHNARDGCTRLQKMSHRAGVIWVPGVCRRALRAPRTFNTRVQAVQANNLQSPKPKTLNPKTLNQNLLKSARPCLPTVTRRLRIRLTLKSQAAPDLNPGWLTPETLNFGRSPI